MVQNKGQKYIKLNGGKHIIGHMYSMPNQRQPPYQVIVTQLKQKWIKSKTYNGNNVSS